VNASIPGHNFSIFCASLFREDYLFENFFNVLSAVFVAFLGRVAVYLLRTVESSGLLYAAGGNFNNRDQKKYSDFTFYSLNLCLSFVRLSSDFMYHQILSFELFLLPSCSI
jgi:uncharacterized membrane protein (UPF0182 family)